ncbi:TPA: hypothetical protein ACSPZR_001018 [Aeromonas veronii]
MVDLGNNADHLNQRIAVCPLRLAGEQVALLDDVWGEVGHGLAFMVVVDMVSV